MSNVNEFRTATAYQIELIRRVEQLVERRRTERKAVEEAFRSGQVTVREAHEQELRKLTAQFEQESEGLGSIGSILGRCSTTTLSWAFSSWRQRGR